MSWKKANMGAVDYLCDDHQLTKKFYLNEIKNASIHWADWKSGCLMKKEFLGPDYASHILGLQSTPVYCKTMDTESARFKHVWRITQYDYYLGVGYPEKARELDLQAIHISPTKESWGFIPGDSYPEWFSYDDFLLVIYDALMREILPFRQLRLHINCPVMLKYQTQEEQANMANICQITPTGLLIRMTYDLFQALQFSKRIQLRVRLAHLWQLNGVGLEKFGQELAVLGADLLETKKTGTDIYSFAPDKLKTCGNLISRKLTASFHGVVTVFLSYADLIGDNLRADGLNPQAISMTLEHLEHQFEEAFAEALPFLK